SKQRSGTRGGGGNRQLTWPRRPRRSRRSIAATQRGWGMELDIVSLSRLQFALTAMYHFLFVPLTLGLSVLLAIMETVYVMTARPIWRQMTKFWGTLFGINFALGVATGI